MKAQIWDTSGAKQFLTITTNHYRFAVGAFLIYDITNLASFTNLKLWLDKIREYSDSHVKIALIGNKSDLDQNKDINSFVNIFGKCYNEEDKDNMGYSLDSSIPNPSKPIIDIIYYEGGDKEKH